MVATRWRTPHLLLTAHFLRQFLENDLISPEADRSQLLAVVSATMLSLTLFVSSVMSFPYVSPILTPGQAAVLSLSDKFFYLALAMIVVTIVNPVPSSLSYASGILVLIAMVGWVLEARQIAGPPPEVEPEHEEEEEAPGPSYWPVVLAIGIVGIAAGLIYDYEWGALIIAVPLAIASAAAWGSHIQREFAEAEAARAAGIAIRALASVRL